MSVVHDREMVGKAKNYTPPLQSILSTAAAVPHGQRYYRRCRVRRRRNGCSTTHVVGAWGAGAPAAAQHPDAHGTTAAAARRTARAAGRQRTRTTAAAGAPPPSPPPPPPSPVVVVVVAVTVAVVVVVVAVVAAAAAADAAAAACCGSSTTRHRWSARRLAVQRRYTDCGRSGC